MLDLKKSFASVVLEKPIATGYSISTEGMALQRIVEDGVEKVAPAVDGGNAVIGFSMANNENVATAPVIETVTAPTITAPATGLVSLSHQLLTADPAGGAGLSEIRIYDETSSTALTQVAAGPLAGNDFIVNPLTGKVTLHSGQSKHVLTVYYRYNLTVQQSQQLYWQPNINNTSINFLGLVGLYTGKGQIFTMEYDMTQDYSSLPSVLTTCTIPGKVSVGGGVTLTGMRVIKAPSAADLSLGIEFNI